MTNFKVNEIEISDKFQGRREYSSFITISLLSPKCKRMIVYSILNLCKFNQHVTIMTKHVAHLETKKDINFTMLPSSFNNYPFRFRH